MITRSAARVEGVGSLADLLGDNVVYRSLTPVNPDLPGLESLTERLGITPGSCPRKTELDYARVVAEILKKAMFSWSGESIERVVYVGDTRYNDGSAWRNLCAVLDCPGVGFIAAESDDAEAVEVIEEQPDRHLLLANRWHLLSAIDKHLAASGQAVDNRTAVVMDMDKTLLGARGRNDQVIDQARMAAVERTLAEYLGAHFDEADFRRVYDRFNGQQYHSFTTDNQDYLAFLCLMIGANLVEENDLAAMVVTGELESFVDFLDLISSKENGLTHQMKELHHKVLNAVAAGDPTPFKDFRRNEFLETAQRMKPTTNDLEMTTLLASEIVITHEVLAQGLQWRQQGAVVLALSDKPDEASIPTQEHADRGFEPLHRISARIVSAI